MPKFPKQIAAFYTSEFSCRTTGYFLRYAGLAIVCLFFTAKVAYGQTEPVKINFGKIRNVKQSRMDFHGRKVKIMGWMVPVDAATDVKYFLLVSNSRYCIRAGEGDRPALFRGTGICDRGLRGQPPEA